MIAVRYQTYTIEDRAANKDLDLLKQYVEDIKKTYKGPIVLVTGDSWSAGEWDIDKGIEWVAEHSIAKYLEDNHRIASCWAANPGHADLMSLELTYRYHHLFDYVVFVKSCSSRALRYLTEEQLEAMPDANIFNQWTNHSNLIYKELSLLQNKLILIGGLNKINGEGLKLNTFMTIPSIMEEYDQEYKASEWFGDEAAWDIYKKYSKFQKSLLEGMEHFYKQKSYLASKPELYRAGNDKYHPNRTIHKDLADKIAKEIKNTIIYKLWQVS